MSLTLHSSSFEVNLGSGNGIPCRLKTLEKSPNLKTRSKSIWNNPKISVLKMCKILVSWSLNPIKSVLWNYVMECGGAIMARIGFRHPEAVRRQPKAQK